MHTIFKLILLKMDFLSNVLFISIAFFKYNVYLLNVILIHYIQGRCRIGVRLMEIVMSFCRFVLCSRKSHVLCPYICEFANKVTFAV